MVMEVLITKSNLGQKSISFMGPSIWSKLRHALKILTLELRLLIIIKSYF